MTRFDSSAGFGFVSVDEDSVAGTVGGLLILSPHGRPLELHCSVPIRVNRAQEILYGRSLTRQLYVHTIAPALFAALGQPPRLVLTDCAVLLEYRRYLSCPLLSLAAGRSSAQSAAPMPEFNRHELPFAGASVQTEVGYEDDLEMARRIWAEDEPNLEMPEPFHRLHEALREMRSAPAAVQAA